MDPTLDAPTFRLSLTPQPHDLPCRHSSFVLTLPFDQDLVKRYITERILIRTQKRWEWFAEAQRLDPTLGTLRYLPAEVRRMKWKAVFRSRSTLSVDGTWEYDRTLGSIFDLSAYYFGFGHRGLPHNDYKGVRSVSSTMKAESDEVFFNHRLFRFNDARHLDHFLHQVSRIPSAVVRSIELGITPVYLKEPWLEPLAQLPSDLLDIRFRVYHVHLGWYDSDSGNESLKNLEELVEQAVQAAPNARISITSVNSSPLHPQCQKTADAILERLRESKMQIERDLHWAL